jgi:hypothetical protein
MTRISRKKCILLVNKSSAILPFVTCCCSLVSEDGQEEYNILYDKVSPYPALVGTLISSSFHLFSPNGTESVYFIFSDLSVRAIGRFRLKFTLFDLAGADINGMTQLTTDKGRKLHQVLSKVFTVYSSAEFTGIMGTF